jgi:hypothetical protein
VTNALATTDPQEPTGLALVIQRLAENPAVDVDKLERIIGLQTSLSEMQAKTLFNAAMSAAQAEMRRVSADANNPQTHSRYASYAAIDRELRPVYTRHGFGLSFDTGDGAQADYVRLVCEVTHTGGYSKSYHLDMPADGKGAKGGDVMTKTHAVGSAMSYGMRYLLKMIFNVAVGEDDDDGNRAGAKTAQPVVDEPAGFAAWADDMSAAACEGGKVFNPAWDKSPGPFKTFALAHRRSLTEGWKATVKRVGKAVTQ